MNETSQQNCQDFANVCAEITALHERKNHDYGNAFGDLYQDFAERGKVHGMTYAIGHLQEKLNRIKTLTYDGAMVKGESIEDSLLDLASYAIMTLAEYRKLPKGV